MKKNVELLKNNFNDLKWNMENGVKIFFYFKEKEKEKEFLENLKKFIINRYDNVEYKVSEEAKTNYFEVNLSILNLNEFDQIEEFIEDLLYIFADIIQVYFLLSFVIV